MPPRVLATFITTTSYGTWLPGDLRGFVADGVLLPHQPGLLNFSKSMLAKAPVHFTNAEIAKLDEAIHAAADEFGYRITDLSIESWHLHWIAEHGYDPVPTMVGRLKTRMRQALERGRIWTDGYCHECMTGVSSVEAHRGYIARHLGCHVTGGVRVGPPTLSDGVAPRERGVDWTRPPAEPGATGVGGECASGSACHTGGAA